MTETLKLDIAMHQARRIGRAVQLAQGCEPTETELSFWGIFGPPDTIDTIKDAVRLLQTIIV